MKLFLGVIFFFALFQCSSALFTNKTFHRIYNASVEENECIAPYTVVLVVTNNETDAFADYQIAPLRQKECYSRRFVYVPTDEISMKNCIQRNFGICARTHFISFDENFSVFVLIFHLLSYNMNVIHYDPRVVLFNIPNLPFMEESPDIIIQKKEVNDTKVDFSQALFYPTNTTMYFVEEYFLTMDQSQELHLTRDEAFDRLPSSEHAKVDFFRDGVISTCWNMRARDVIWSAMNGYTCNVACENKEDTLMMMKYLTSHSY